jgi:hypothetical protein
MLYTDLALTSSRIINSGAEYAVYFNVENADEPLDHGTGGKTILQGSEYTGTVDLTLGGTVGPLRVSMRHENSDGTPSTVTSNHDIMGYVGETYAVSVTGTVPATKGLTVLLTNTGPTSITVTRVGVRLLSQAV